MQKYWQKNLLISWIAIFAILLSALAPSILTALTVRSGNSSSWAEICSTQNRATSNSKKSLTSLSTTSDTHESTHCPFCLPHAGNFALPPAVLLCCAVAAGHDAFPPLYYQAPSLLFSWVTANPRGPPQLS